MKSILIKHNLKKGSTIDINTITQGSVCPEVCVCNIKYPKVTILIMLISKHNSEYQCNCVPINSIIKRIR